MKSLALGFACLTTSVALAQAPDVRIRGDLSLGMASSKEYSLGGRTYTPLGRHSVITLQTYLPVGLRVVFAERVQPIKNDPDDDAFDEYYVEDPGSWRVGKQYVPFGGGAFFHQSVQAARIDSNLALGGVPLAIAIADGGNGRQYGVVGRIGGRGLGLSFAVGRHWGVNSSSMALTQSLQKPEGLGNGWKQAVGVDIYRRSQKFVYRTEAIVLRQPEGTSKDKEAGDFLVTYDLGHRHSAFAGVSKVFGDRETFTRLGCVYNAAKGIQLEGTYRLTDRNFRDFSIFLHVRF
ncbi:MAG: hypothetical protein JST12_03135 [Armatimonadetes bacterium]|nr:hypothetical protein [Armatimonadota bacterium]MBS1700628.1 hypothetical protein [Armatimonadota bacterium]